MELKHHRLGPSGAKTWLNCTWSPQLQAKFPDEESWYAAQGTAAHMVTEWARDQGRPAADYLGHTVTFPKQNPEDGDWEFEVDQEMVDACQDFLDYVNGLPVENLSDIYVEELLHYDPWVEGGFGTVDDIRFDDETGVCYVTDFKYGKGVVVEAEDNWQLWLYCLAAYHTYGHLYEIDKFVIGIMQPRNGGLTTAEVSLAFLLDWGNEFVKPRALEAASETEGRYAPSEDACRFCRARHRCRARAAWVMNQVDPDYPTLSNNELAMIHPHISDMRRALDSWEAEILSQLEQGHQVGDLKLVAGRRGGRKWVDQEAALKALTSRAKTGGQLKKDQVFKPGPMISPTEAEKILGKDHPLITKTEKDGDIVRKIDSDLISRADGKPVVVGGDDPREPLTIDATNEFEDVSNE